MAEAKTDPAAAKLAEDKKKLAEETAAREKAAEAHAKIFKGTPTPTQEELNLLNLGNHPELAPDGSTDPLAIPKEVSKHSEPSGGGAGYQTRQASPKHTG